MPDRKESEWEDESIERFDVETASDEMIADKIRDLSDDLYFLIEVAQIRGLIVTGCQVAGENTMVLGHQYPVSIQTEVKIIRTELL